MGQMGPVGDTERLGSQMDWRALQPVRGAG